MGTLQDSANGRPTASPRDALVVFLGVTAVSMLGLALVMRYRPDWLGAATPATQGADDATSGRVDPRAPFEPRPPAGDELAEGSARGARLPVDRRPAPMTLAQSIFADALPSVTHVTTLETEGRGDLPTPTLPIIGDLTRFVRSTGSGLVWDHEGHLVTCKHVIDDIDGATVLLADGSQWSAKFVGVDPTVDLAVIRIAAPPDRLTPIRVGRSSDLQVGMSVFSVSSPYGLGHSLSVGYVSGLARRVAMASGSVLENAIQTDAGIHHGSSGGALIDDQGRVVGLNTAVLSDSDVAAGVGFAIPIDDVLARVPGIIERGYRWYPTLGLVVSGDAQSAERMADIPPELGVPPRGLVIAQVDQPSPASEAGMRGMQQIDLDGGGAQIAVRDIIVGIGDGTGGEVRREDLDRAVDALAPGEPLRLKIARRAGELDVEIVPSAR